MLIEIKNRFNGSVIFSHEQEGNSLKITLEMAVKAGAYLDHANLYGANLALANLAGAYLAGAYLDRANLYGANLAHANLAGAYLYGANLYGANLALANLAGAYLAGAYLDGATYGIATLKNGSLQLLGKFWPVYIFDAHIKIGCQLHSTKDWEAFGDEQIAAMDDSALPFWKENKEIILTLAKHHQKSTE